MLTNPLKKRAGASADHYVRTVHELLAERRYARPTDIARKLGVSRGSVSVMLREMAARGLVRHIDRSHVALTLAGAERAHHVISCYDVLRAFHQEVLGIPAKEAQEEACLMEHFVAPRTLDRLGDLLSFFRETVAPGRGLSRAFESYRRRRSGAEICACCGFSGEGAAAPGAGKASR